MSQEQHAAGADMEKVVARAIEDEDFRRRLGEDPEGTITAEGYALSAEEMAAVKQNVDPDLSQEQLEDRVSKAALPWQPGRNVKAGPGNDGNLDYVPPSRYTRPPR